MKVQATSALEMQKQTLRRRFVRTIIALQILPT